MGDILGHLFHGNQYSVTDSSGAKHTITINGDGSWTATPAGKSDSKTASTTEPKVTKAPNTRAYKEHVDLPASAGEWSNRYDDMHKEAGSSTMPDVSDSSLLDAEAGLHTMFAKAVAVDADTSELERAHDLLTSEMRKRDLFYTPLTKAYEPTVEERRAGAANGIAMPDGSFHIPHEAALHQAIGLVHQAQDPQAAMQHIMNRAKAMGMEHALPQHWTNPDLAKPKPPAPGAYSMAPPTNTVQPGQPPKPSPGAVAKSTRQKVTEALVTAMNKAFGDDTDYASHDLDTSTPIDLVEDIDYAVIKSSPEERYTLGPVYIPNQYDAHDEWATPEDMEKACWEYVKSTGADRTIYLQHSPQPAGEWVGILTWPQEVNTRMMKSVDGVQKAEVVKFPAGTPWMGVQWEPWAWEEVKKGHITGFSMGGYAKRIEAEIS